MKDMTGQDLIKRVIRWLLVIVMVVFLLTGFGITEFRTVETLTFGLLTKPLAFKIHENLWIPLLVLLVLHIGFSPLSRLYKRKQSGA
jgi:cytochrome b subunit of formate dehydrogenase